jgi:malate dehydrogenase
VNVGKYAPDAMLMIVTNPVDIMTFVALRYSGMKPGKVFGLGTHLDSMRLKSLIASHFKVHVSEVHTRIIGEHGESMVPLWSATTIGGIQISNLPTFDNLPINEIMDKVRSSGRQIIANKGSTVWGPGEAIATIIRTILGNENRILTLTAYVKREVHNIGNVCIGVPVRINRKGVFPVTIKLNQDEVDEFEASAQRIRDMTQQVLAGIELHEDSPVMES